jgi:hypothetical protein
MVKSLGLTQDSPLKLLFLSFGEGNGIAGVGVTSVDISRNAGSESDYLAKH